jgi:hypothetical protein
MVLPKLFGAAVKFLTRGIHRSMARRIPKPISVAETAAKIITRDEAITRPDAVSIAELIDEGTEAGAIIEAQLADEPIDAEIVPLNVYSAEQLPLGDRYTIEIEVDIFDEDGDLIKTIPVTTTASEGTTAAELDAFADEVIDSYYRQSPTMFGGSSIENVNTVKRQIVYAERGF